MDTTEFSKINKAGNWVNIAYIIACFSLSPGFINQSSPVNESAFHKVSQTIKVNKMHEKIQHAFRGIEYVKK